MREPFNLFTPKQDRKFAWIVVFSGLMASILLLYPVFNEANWDPDLILAVVKKQQTLKTILDVLLSFCVAILASYLY